MEDTWLRVRAALGTWFPAVVVALVLISGLGGYLTYVAYADPGTHVEERTVASWQTTGSFDHSAMVTENNSVFPVGTTLENRSVYFLAVSPVLDGQFEFTYTASDGGSLRTAIDLELVLHSVGERDGRTVEFWRVSEPLGSKQVTLTPGESVSMGFSRNVSALATRAERIREELGASPGTIETLVVADVTADGTVNGDSVSFTNEYVLPVTFESGTYRVADAGAVTDSSRAVEPVAVQNSYGLLHRRGGPALVFLGLGGLLALLGARLGGHLDVTDAERRWLDYRAARREFDEWITPARLPQELVNGQRVECESLGGLVDLAIDTDRRVVEDRDRRRYFVMDEDRTFTYVPPRAGAPDPVDPLTV